MPENRGNALTYAAATTHRPLPRADEKAYRAAHQPQKAPPATTFDWDWNKAECTGCQTKVARSTLVDGQCPTCRGVAAPRPTRTRAPREHSKDGEQVYVAYDQDELNARYHPPVATLTEAPVQTPAGGHAPGASSEPSVEREAATAPPAGPVDLLALQLEHTTSTLSRAHGITDPIVGVLRAAVWSSLAALDLYIELHHTTVQPAPPPASFQTFEKPRQRRHTPRTPELVQQIVEGYVSGESLRDLSHEHGITARLIRQMITDAGHPIRPKGGNRHTVLHRIEALGTTCADIKVWGVNQGLIPEIPRGVPSAALVDAYEAAQQTGGTT
jgi:hypothetical protein